MLSSIGKAASIPIERRGSKLSIIKNKVLSSVLGLLIIVTIGSIVYVSHTPPAKGAFTELYVLGVDGKAADYPRTLAVGGQGRVLVGIINHEYQKREYRLVVAVSGSNSEQIDHLVLEHEEKWEQQISFTPKTAGTQQKVEFLLYKGKEVKPCAMVYLWLDVIETNEAHLSPSSTSLSK